MAEEQLHEAYQLLKDGQKMRAEAILRPIVDAEPENADAWWLLANAVDEPDEIRAALGQVVRLRPDHAKAALMLRRINERYPADDSATSIEALLNADYEDDAPRRVTVTKAKGSNNRRLVVVLVMLVVLSVIGCAACFLFAGGVVVLDELMTDPDFARILNNLVESIGDERLPTPRLTQGTIERGQATRTELGPNIEHAWMFRGTAGDDYQIDVKALSNNLDPVLYLYGPGGALIAQNDDRDSDTLDAQIKVELPEDGNYTIVVTEFDNSDGRYELRLEFVGPIA
jgi:hypothetical protein